MFACGLATDYCVAHSALDARAAGFDTFVIDDACRAIDSDGSLEAAWAKMNAAQSLANPGARDFGLGRVRLGAALPLPPLNPPGPMTGFSLS